MKAHGQWIFLVGHPFKGEFSSTELCIEGGEKVSSGKKQIKSYFRSAAWQVFDLAKETHCWDACNYCKTALPSKQHLSHQN